MCILKTVPSKNGAIPEGRGLPLGDNTSNSQTCAANFRKYFALCLLLEKNTISMYYLLNFIKMYVL